MAPFNIWEAAGEINQAEDPPPQQQDTDWILLDLAIIVPLVLASLVVLYVVIACREEEKQQAQRALDQPNRVDHLREGRVAPYDDDGEPPIYVTTLGFRDLDHFLSGDTPQNFDLRYPN